MSTALAGARRKFAGLTDDRLGLIRKVELVRPAPGDPPAFVAYAEPCETAPLAGLAAANRGAAASLDVDRAIVRACGESVERYCSAFFRLDDLRLDTVDRLRAEGAAVVPVDALYPFAADQYADPDFPFERVDGRAQRWVTARSAAAPHGLAEPAECWVPASCVYVPYMFDREVEPFTHMPISTGLAAGESLTACVDKGVLEILERDALMICWYHRLPRPRIDVDSCLGVDPLLDNTVRAGMTSGARWHLNLLTLDIDVPVVSAALIDETGPPMTSMGIAAHTDPVRAVLLAAEEALLTRVLLARSDEIATGTVPARATTLRAHMLVHAASRRLRDVLRFLTDAPEVVGLDEIGGAPGPPPHRLAGVHAWYVDVTTPDVAAAGFHVVRTLLPGFQPLDNDDRYRYLGGRRLVDVPARLGLRTAEPNPFPHPFP